MGSELKRYAPAGVTEGSLFVPQDFERFPFCNNVACNSMVDYHKAGLLYLKDGRVLLCRKKDTASLLILPGGKLEPGETAEECLRRECREELGEVEITGLRHIGDYESSAAGQDGKTVKIELYAGELEGTPAAHSEIQDLVSPLSCPRM